MVFLVMTIIAYGVGHRLMTGKALLNCLLCGKAICGDAATGPLIRIETPQGWQLAHDACVPNCQMCKKPISAADPAKVAKNGSAWRPRIVHVSCSHFRIGAAAERSDAA